MLGASGLFPVAPTGLFYRLRNDTSGHEALFVLGGIAGSLGTSVANVDLHPGHGWEPFCTGAPYVLDDFNLQVTTLKVAQVGIGIVGVGPMTIQWHSIRTPTEITLAHHVDRALMSSTGPLLDIIAPQLDEHDIGGFSHTAGVSVGVTVGVSLLLPGRR